MSAIKQILLSLVVVAVAAGAWYVYDRGYLSGAEPTAAGRPGGGPPGGGPPGGGGGRGFGRTATPVVAALVDTDNTSLEVHAIGTVAAARAVTLYPQVSGIVTEIDFTPGTKVDAGATLVKLDDSDQQVAVDRARIALASAQAALDRARQLAKSNNITSVALTDAESAVQKAEIDRKSAQLELAKRTVKAPFAGTIGLTDVTVGDLVNSSKAIATLDDMSTVTTAFNVPERASGRVAVGQQVAATTEALAGQRFQGAISAVDSRVDPVARTLRVEATLPNDANVLKPGMALAIDLSFPGEDHPAVPSLAVQWDRDGSYVWKLDGDTVHRVNVDIVDRRSGTVIVVGDLEPGDAVVSQGGQRLREGARVNVVESDAAGGAPEAGAGTRPPNATDGAGGVDAAATPRRPRSG
jgi:RND family efflux transporter MFP subunit